MILALANKKDLMNYFNYLKDLSDKIKPTLDAVKTDFTEIKKYILPESSNDYIQHSSDFAKKHILNNLLEGSKVFKEGIDTIWHAHSEIPNTKCDKPRILLLQAQENEQTYLSDYTNDENFLQWENLFVLDSEKNALELKNNIILQRFYTNLVPEKVAEDDFWKRYYYKVYLLEQDEKMRQSLLLRASTSLKDDLAWDGNEDDWEITSSIISTPEIISQDLVKNDSNNTSNLAALSLDDENLVEIDKIPEIHGTSSQDKEITKKSSQNEKNIRYKGNKSKNTQAIQNKGDSP